MDISVGSNYLLWVVIGVILIARQFMPVAINPKKLVAVPLIAGYFGLQALLKAPPTGTLALDLLALSSVLGAALGVARALTLRIWRGADGWMARGTPLTLALWLASIGIKVGLAFAMKGVVPLDELPLFLGITFAAQNAALWARVQRRRAPAPGVG